MRVCYPVSFCSHDYAVSGLTNYSNSKKSLLSPLESALMFQCCISNAFARTSFVSSKLLKVCCRCGREVVVLNSYCWIDSCGLLSAASFRIVVCIGITSAGLSSYMACSYISILMFGLSSLFESVGISPSSQNPQKRGATEGNKICLGCVCSTTLTEISRPAAKVTSVGRDMCSN